MPQFQIQLAVPQLYNERSMRARLSPARTRGRRNPALSPDAGCREGLPGTVRGGGGAQGRLPPARHAYGFPRGGRRRRPAQRIGRKVAALRGGVSANCPSASPPANTKRRERKREHGGVKRESFGSTASSWQGRSSAPSKTGRQESPAPGTTGEKHGGKQTKRVKEAPSWEKGRSPKAPRRIAAGRSASDPGDCPAGRREVRRRRSPRVWGSRRRPQEKEVCSPPPTGLRHQGAGKLPPSPGPASPATAPRGQSPHPRPLTCWAGGRPARFLAERCTPAKFRASAGGRGQGRERGQERGGGAGSSRRRGAEGTGGGGGRTRLCKATPGYSLGKKKLLPAPLPPPAPLLAAPTAAALSPRAQLTPGGAPPRSRPRRTQPQPRPAPSRCCRRHRPAEGRGRLGAPVVTGGTAAAPLPVRRSAGVSKLGGYY
ncbi:translation initiation factor IF-2-like [Dryobates pubescens]|uniref:translation initiation factor IF-2-like n=1 Tax=Dryobates pubescens TaxID=118200 RepID=UPI0023B8E1DE|nr:translation initiation factor IF-2-like [Dryobates pubescens]